jgi:hypothetical protein
MLAGTRRHDRVVGGQRVHRLDDELRFQGFVRGRGVRHRVRLLPPAASLAPRGGVGGSGQRVGELIEYGRRVAHERIVGVDVLRNLGGVDVDVDHLGAGSEVLDAAREAVVESGADREHHVAVLERQVRVAGAVHPRDVHGEVVVLRERADTRHRRHDGDAVRPGEPSELAGRFALDHATAREDDGPLGTRERVRGRRDGLAVSRRWPTDASQAVGDPGRSVGVGQGAVLGQVHQRRARPPVARHRVRLADGVPDRVRIGGEVVRLRHGIGHPPRVHLLEGVLAHEAGGSLSRQGQHRIGVHVRVGQPRHEVGRAGARRGQADAGVAGDDAVRGGGVCRALFVTHRDVTDVGVIQRVVDGHDRPALDAEGVLHVRGCERRDDGLRAGRGRSCRRFLGRVLGSCRVFCHRVSGGRILVGRTGGTAGRRAVRAGEIGGRMMSGATGGPRYGPRWRWRTHRSGRATVGATCVGASTTVNTGRPYQRVDQMRRDAIGGGPVRPSSVGEKRRVNGRSHLVRRPSPPIPGPPNHDRPVRVSDRHVERVGGSWSGNRAEPNRYTHALLRVTA